MVFKKVAEHLVGTSDGNGGRGFNGFSTQGLGNLAWSYAKQAQLAEGGSESKIGSSGRLAVYEAISMDVGGNLIRQLFSGIAEAALNTSSKFYASTLLIISPLPIIILLILTLPNEH